MPRDPRVDPRPGDMVREGNYIRTVVTGPERSGIWVGYTLTHIEYGPQGGLRAETRAHWKAALANAEVLHAAD